MEVDDRIWRTSTQAYLRMLPQRIGVRARQPSKRLRRVLSDFGSEHSFGHAAGQLKEHYGFEMNVSAVRLATLQQADRARQRLQRDYKESFRALPSRGAEQFIAQADGTMICTVSPGPRNQKRPREWKEMRLAGVGSKDQVQTVYAAGFMEVDELGRRWGHCARDAGRGLNTRVHVVADGADWIRLQSQEVFGDQGSFLCDFYHVSQYLAQAGEVCRPHRPSEWRRTQQKRLKRGALDKVLEALFPYQEEPTVPEEEAPVRSCSRYLSRRKDCLDYPGALKKELPIGSGMIESGHKHVLQSRLKKAGAAWLADTADKLANLRALRANGKWETLWN